MDLSPGERTIFSGHPSWRSIVGFYIKWIFLSAVAAALVAGATKIFDDRVRGGTVALVMIAGTALALLVGLIKRISTTYTITDRRLHIKRGILSREIQETRLERVQNVSYSQSILQRLLRVGSVDFDTAAGEDYEFSFAGVASPAKVVADVDRATAAGAGDPGTSPAPAAAGSGAPET